MASLKKILAYIERNLILDSLEKTKRDQKKATEILGLKYTTLHEKIKRYHIYFRTVVI
ncbi:helix-turn-helix domain-containing protein [Acidobacteriota bacterium]